MKLINTLSRKIITEINYDNRVWKKIELDKTFENLVQNSHYNKPLSIVLI